MSGPSDLQAGDPRELREGRYRIEKVLGRGGAASVFQVWDRTLEVHRAAKVLSKELADDAVFRERFVREARTIARLSHPHIVTVHDVGRDGERDYMVMEEVTGGTLLDLARGEVAPARVCRLVREATEALAHAHEAGVVHRDVKPHNILLTADDRAKLSDFGIARADNAERQLTGSGTVLGTWSYMAPEQLEDMKSADHRVDIYGMGATLYAVLTQRLMACTPPKATPPGCVESPRSWLASSARRRPSRHRSASPRPATWRRRSSGRSGRCR